MIAKMTVAKVLTADLAQGEKVKGFAVVELTGPIDEIREAVDGVFGKTLKARYDRGARCIMAFPPTTGAEQLELDTEAASYGK